MNSIQQSVQFYTATCTSEEETPYRLGRVRKRCRETDTNWEEGLTSTHWGWHLSIVSRSNKASQLFTRWWWGCGGYFRTFGLPRIVFSVPFISKWRLLANLSKLHLVYTKVSLKRLKFNMGSKAVFLFLYSLAVQVSCTFSIIRE